MKQAKTYLKPMAVVTFLVICLVGFSLFYCYFQGLGRNSIGLEVEFQTGNFLFQQEFSEFGLPSLSLVTGDKITELDGKPIATFLNEGGYLFVTDPSNYSRNVFFRPVYHYPYPTNTTLLLLSGSPESMTVILGNQTKQINLKALPANQTNNLLISVQFGVALFFWLTGVVLFWFRPDQPITLCFNIHFGFGGIYLIVNYLTNRYKDDFIFLLVISCSCLIPLGLMYFVLAFPHGQVARARTRYFLAVIALPVVSVNLILIGLHFGFNRSYNPTVQLLLNLRLFAMALLLLIGYITLFVRFYRSSGTERLKIRLVCMTLLISWVTPLTLFLLSVFFNLLPGFIYNYFIIFCAPTVLFPLALLYSILKHGLFYPDLIVRNILSYLLLTIFLSLLYFFTTLVLANMLKLVFGLEDSGLGLVAFGLIALLAARLQTLSQRVIERIFYRDKINYTDLIRDWTAKLVFSKASLTELCQISVSGLAKDFRYDKVALLLIEDSSFDDKNLDFLLENFEASDKLIDANYRAYLITPDIPNNPSCEEDGLIHLLLDAQQLSQAGLGLSCTQFCTLPSQFNLTHICPPPLIDSLPTYAYQFFVPFSRKGILCGGILFGAKLSEQPPGQEEYNALTSVAHQIALAVDTAVKVAVEKSHHQLLKTFLTQWDAIRDNELRKIGREIHDTTIQQINQINLRLTLFKEKYQAELGHLAPEAHRLIDESLVFNQNSESYLREAIERITPRFIELGLSVALEELVEDFTRLFPTKHFNFTSFLSDEEEEYTTKFDQEECSNIYRIVQEALTNAVKHSGGGHFNVYLMNKAEEDNFELLVEICDDGKGFSQADLGSTELLAKGHRGLIFMKERVKNLNGHLVLKNGTDGGGMVQAAFAPKALCPHLSEGEV